MNILSTIASFFDPKQNRQRLENAGLYQPRETPMPQAAPPSGGVQGPPMPRQPAADPQAIYQSPAGGSRNKYDPVMAQAVMSKYIEAGYSPEYAAGMAGNAQVESSGNPNAFNEKENAIGIFQWTPSGGRRGRLEQFAADRGEDYRNMMTQIDFSLYEKTNFEKAAYDKIMGSSPTSAADYAAAIDRHYERSSQEQTAQRQAYATQIYNDWMANQNNQGGLTYNLPSMYNKKPGTSPYATESGQVLTYGDHYRVDKPQELMAQPKDFVPFNTELAQAEAPAQPVVNNDTANYAAVLGRNLGWADGDEKAVPPAPAAPAASAPQSPSKGSASSEAVVEEKSPFVERILDSIYKTDEKDKMTAEDRRDRRVAIARAIGEGFRELGGGPAANYGGIIKDRYDRGETRRAAASLAKNAQGVSDLMVASGRPDLANLPFMGKEGMSTAMNILSQKSSAGGTWAGLNPTTKAVLAQQMRDNGQEGLATAFETATGESEEIMFKSIMEDSAKVVTGGTAEGDTYSAAEKEGIKEVLRSYGEDRLANLVDVVPDKTISKMMEDFNTAALNQTRDRKNVDNTFATQGNQAVLDNALDENKNARTTQRDATLNQYAVDAATTKDQRDQAGEARAYERQVDRDNANEARAIASDARKDEYTKKAEIRALDAKAKEEDKQQMKRKEAAKAIAQLFPESDRDAMELALANAETSQDRAGIIDVVKPGTTPDIINVQFRRDNPELAKELDAALAARSGVPKPKTTMVELTRDTVVKANAKYMDGQAANKRVQTNMTMMRQIALDPKVEFGVLQSDVLTPMQSYLSSTYSALGLGDAPNIVSDQTMMGASLGTIAKNFGFVNDSQAISGALSDMEGARFDANWPSLRNTREQVLAASQYQLGMAKIKDAEHTAMLEWMQKNEGTDKEGDLTAMKEYISKATEWMEIFPTYKGSPEEQKARLTADEKAGKLPLGTIVYITGEDGRETMMMVGARELGVEQ